MGWMWGGRLPQAVQACDLYASADYEDIDVFMKPAGYANFNIVFAQGKMVLAYSASSVAEKKLPPIAEPGQPSIHLTRFQTRRRNGMRT